MDGIEQYDRQRQRARAPAARMLRAGLRLALSLPTLEERYPLPGSQKYQQAVEYLQQGPGVQDSKPTWVLLFSWVFLHNLGRCPASVILRRSHRHWIDEWLFGRVLTDAARSMGDRAKNAPRTSSSSR